ncbi:MAG TPA: efflux RND transporter permease subunit, partial [Terriglobia bacterium]|nr:efflux RND transporter permease subunit [Terriglobia bacterium]
MWLIRTALRRPISVLVLVVAVALGAVLAALRMRIDIFPNLDLPVIYVAQPYGGMSPAQMEGYLVYYYEYHFLYINGIESVEDKSIQGNGLLKLTFHPGTDMSQALAQTISYVNRAHAFMPYGTVNPFVIRFDAGTVPVGYLVFSSKVRTIGEIQDLALNRIRPLFATLPGVSAPPPFGGNQRTIVVTVNPDRLRSYNLSPDAVVKSISSGNILMPAGNVRTENLLRIVSSDSVTPDIHALLDVPLRTGAGPAVYLRDIGAVADSTDIPTGYALVNGRRAVYIPVTKRPDASTLTVVDEVKQNLARFRSLVPTDIDISYQFDQSGYVKSALLSVVREGLLGALLTGLIVMLFLGDWRSSFIVMTTIPFALLTSVVGLWLCGQTLNIMTLGGLALAVGILVDEGVVEIENIDSTLAQEPGLPVARGVLNATRRTVVARFLSMLSIVAVFVPSLFMTGVAKNLFVPLSLAVGFAMVASFLLSSSLLPVLFLWMHRKSDTDSVKLPPNWLNFDRVRERWGGVLARVASFRWLVIVIYAGAALAILLLLGPLVGRELFPNVTGHQFRLRFDAPAGTRAEETALLVTKVLDEVQAAAGAGNVDISLGYVGTQGASYPINTVFLWTSGPHEAMMNVALRPGAGIDVAALEEKLRGILPPKFPECSFSFEPGDIVSQIMNFGAPTPIELAATGPDFAALRAYTEKLRGELGKVPALRDLRVEQPLNYPSVDVRVNRELAGQLGVTAEQVARSLSEATASSRFTTPNYWTDPKTGVAYQVQVQYPLPRMTSVQDVQSIPVMPDYAAHPLLGDLARVTEGTLVGEYDRINGLWLLSLSANVAGEDLGRVADRIDAAIHLAGDLPRGATVQVRGQIAPMRATFASLGTGLLLAVAVIFLLLAGNFESMRLSLVIFTTAPATLCGVVLMLLATHTTLNVQSYMGAIMALGVGTANAILLVTFAEERRRAGSSALAAGMEGARARMRPIVMTSAAMIAGMIPMALALGEGAEAAAPLGRAVIGGLIAATVANLTVLPFIFALVQSRAGTTSASLDPDDPESRYAG